jgi:hypothetical protein
MITDQHSHKTFIFEIFKTSKKYPKSINYKKNPVGNLQMAQKQPEKVYTVYLPTYLYTYLPTFYRLEASWYKNDKNPRER